MKRFKQSDRYCGKIETTGRDKRGEFKMANLRAAERAVALTTGLGLSIFGSTTIAALSGLPAYADMNTAVQKYNAKDYQGALNEFKAVCTKDPKNALSHYYMALCDQCLARVDDAKKEYQWVVDNGPANLKGQAQTGLSQLEKVNVRTGGSSSMTASTAPASSSTATTSGTDKPGTDLIDRSGNSKDASGKDAKGKDAVAKDAKGTAAGTTKAGATDSKTAAAAGAAGNVGKVLNFFSESSRQSQLTEPSWEEVKNKYPKLTFTKINVGDPLCEKYNVSEFPTIIVVDKNGKALNQATGQQGTDGLSSLIDGCLSKK
jgi:thioredoxin-like negative regulator of GroEL